MTSNIDELKEFERIPSPLKIPKQMLESISVEGLSYDGSCRYLVTIRYYDGGLCTDKFLVWNYKQLLDKLSEYDEIP